MHNSENNHQNSFHHFSHMHMKTCSKKGRASQDIWVKLLSLGTNANLAKKVKVRTYFNLF